MTIVVCIVGFELCREHLKKLSVEPALLDKGAVYVRIWFYEEKWVMFVVLRHFLVVVGCDNSTISVHL